MPSNTTLDAGTGGDVIVTKERTHDGDASKQQGVFLSGVTGTEGSYTYEDINGSAANGLEVDVTRVQGTVTVDGSGVTQPVSGTVTANLSATDNAVLDSILAAQKCEIDANNSTATPLVGDEVYTGTATDVTEFHSVLVQVFADQDSATDGVSIQTSNDGTNWDHSHDYTYLASTKIHFEAALPAQYFRIVYTNGSTIQGAFRLQVKLVRAGPSPHFHSVEYAIDGAHPSQIVRNINVAKKPNGDYTNIQATAGGNLKISVQEISDGLDVGAGNAGSETQRVSISTDDVNLSGILADTASMDTNLWTVAGAVAGTEMQVDVVASLPAGDNNIGNVDIVSLPASTNTLEVVGDVAHDAAAAGNPVLGAARATNSIEGLTQVANADSSYVTSDLNGCLVTRQQTTLEEVLSERVTNTDGASTAFSTFAAGGAGVHNYVTSIIVHNSHASTSGFVDIRDGTAGGVLATIPAPATGGTAISFPVPLKGSANTALAYDASAAITTIYVTIIGFQAQG